MQFQDRRSKPKSSNDISEKEWLQKMLTFLFQQRIFKADTARSVAQVAKQTF